MISKKRALGVIGLLLLTGCNDPHHMVLPTDANAIDASTREHLQKLPADERDLVARYMVRHLIGNSSPIPPGTTVAEAITEQRGVDQRLAQREQEEAALKASVEKEQADARAKLDAAVAVVLVSKQYTPADVWAGRYSAKTEFTVAYSNKSDRPIAGVKGTLVFRNLFGDPIKRLGIAMTDAIDVGKTLVWEGSADYNQFEKEDSELAFTPAEKMKIAFEPSVVLFADGTRLTVDK